MLVIWAAQPGPNGQLSCLHSIKYFWPMKPSYPSSEMTWFVAHFDVLKKYLIILKLCFRCKSSIWTFRPPWMRVILTCCLIWIIWDARQEKNFGNNADFFFFNFQYTGTCYYRQIKNLGCSRLLYFWF